MLCATVQKKEHESLRKSKFLSESDTSAASFNPLRFRRDYYKGMSTEQRFAIYQEQEEQRRAMAAKRGEHTYIHTYTYQPYVKK